MTSPGSKISSVMSPMRSRRSASERVSKGAVRSRRPARRSVMEEAMETGAEGRGGEWTPEQETGSAPEPQPRVALLRPRPRERLVREAARLRDGDADEAVAGGLVAGVATQHQRPVARLEQPARLLGVVIRRSRLEGGFDACQVGEEQRPGGLAYVPPVLHVAARGHGLERFFQL